MCVACGTPPKAGNRYCYHCKAETPKEAVICVKCGVGLAGTGQPGREAKDWLTTLLLNIFLGCLGIHRFYTGNTGIGICQLLTFGGCGIWALVDFILILTDTYRDGQGNKLYRK